MTEQNNIEPHEVVFLLYGYSMLFCEGYVDHHSAFMQGWQMMHDTRIR
ncbi:MAG: hypothetical protein ACJ788_21700 [Ktedonobacteraceae bacterium]